MNGLNISTATLMENLSKERTAITFDEVTFQDMPSTIQPSDVSLQTKITKSIKLKSGGLISSAMDTVTEKEMALAMAKLGGLGVIHRNLNIKEQCEQVSWVREKIHYGGMIEYPITYKEINRVSDVESDIKIEGWSFTNFPIVNSEQQLLGMVSRNELEFVGSENPTLSEIMIPIEKLITTANINREEAFNLMKTHKVKKLPVIDQNKKFIGLYAWSDINQAENNLDLFSLDEEGRFLVAAAVGTDESEKERVSHLVAIGCKIIVIDTSHGASETVLSMLHWIKKEFPTTNVIVGNIASYESAEYLIENSPNHLLPDALKVGVSSGSICTTRRVTGHGMPQLTAIYQVWMLLYHHQLHTTIPIIADGGIRYSGDIVKAYSVGASAVMLGNVFAGTDESPGKIVTSDGNKYKIIRGMGSRSAMEDRDGSRMRYFGNTKNKGKLTNNQKRKIAPEGVEATIKYKGPVDQIIHELNGGIRAGLAHSGSDNINKFRKNCCMWKQTNAGINEGNPHSLHTVIDQ